MSKSPHRFGHANSRKNERLPSQDVVPHCSELDIAFTHFFWSET